VVALDVPGRICLFGDKVDLAGKPVIAAAINLFLHIEGEPRPDRRVVLHSYDLDRTEQFALGDVPDYSGAMKYVRAATHLLGDRLPSGYELTYRTNLPIGAGLSSSAAISVGSLLAISRLFDLGLCADELAEYAYQAEHDECGIGCGRMDQYSIAHGGVTFISTGENPHAERLPLEHLPVVIGDSNEPREAKAVLNRIRGELEAGDPRTLAAFDIVHQCVLEGREALIRGDGQRIGELMSRHQDQERRMGCSTRKIEALCHAALRAGAYGAKQMGAGGGGCMVAYCPRRQQQVAEALESVGGIPYICDIFVWPDCC
jgi:galactokinase